MVQIPRCFTTHVVNAWEEDGGVVVEAVSCEELTIRTIPDMRVVRFSEYGSTTILDELVEFPSVNPAYLGKKTRYSYFAALSKRMDCGDGCWLKFDSVTGGKKRVELGRDMLHLEPIFIPVGGPREDDGFLVGFIAYKGKPFVGIADARTMRALCLMEATGCNLVGLHGTWVPET